MEHITSGNEATEKHAMETKSLETKQLEKTLLGIKPPKHNITANKTTQK